MDTVKKNQKLTHLCVIFDNSLNYFQKNILFFKIKTNYFTNLHKCCYNILQIYLFIIMTPEAERFNGWAAMLGFVAAVGAYVTTGQIIPGWF